MPHVSPGGGLGVSSDRCTIWYPGTLLKRLKGEQSCSGFSNFSLLIAVKALGLITVLQCK